MSIELQPSGFYEWYDSPSIPSLGIQSDRLDDFITHYHDAGFRGLFGNPSFGFRHDNLDFLSRTTNATAIWMWDVAIQNIDGVYELAELNYAGINDDRPGIDFSRFPALRTIINHWNKDDCGIFDSPVTEYHLWHFKPRSKSFDGLEVPLGVESLQLNWANPATLEGLPVLKQLKELQIHRCRNLSDLSCLPRVAPNLRQLLATTSSKLNAISGVIDHPKLQTAMIDGRYVVGDSG